LGAAADAVAAVDGESRVGADEGGGHGDDGGEEGGEEHFDIVELKYRWLLVWWEIEMLGVRCVIL